MINVFDAQIICIVNKNVLYYYIFAKNLMGETKLMQVSS